MMWFYTETFKCILCTVWKPKEMNSNCHRCKLFLWGKATYRDSETAFVAHTRGISWVTPCMFTALLGLTLINANQKQISLTLTHHLSWLTADCTSYISQPCASETFHMETVQKFPCGNCTKDPRLYIQHKCANGETAKDMFNPPI